MIQIDIVAFSILIIALLISAVVICWQQKDVWHYKGLCSMQAKYIKELEGYLDSVLTGHNKIANEGLRALQKPMRGCKK